VSDIGRRLAVVRDYLAFDLEYVAEESGVAPPRIAEIEAGTSEPDPLELRRLARCYGYPARHFEGDEIVLDDIPALARLAEELGPRDREEAYRFAQYLRYAAEAD
jgi:transcriptional regulator with XRE-family HTH domain